MPESVRKAVLSRDGWQCQAHARGFALDLPCWGHNHVHHVILRSQGGLNIPEHLVTLCQAHHIQAHDIDRAGAERAGLIVRS